MLVVRLPTSGLQISTSALKCDAKIGSHQCACLGVVSLFLFFFWCVLGCLPVRQKGGTRQMASSENLRMTCVEWMFPPLESNFFVCFVFAEESDDCHNF